MNKVKASLLILLISATPAMATTKVISQTPAASISVSVLVEACVDDQKVIWVMGLEGNVTSPVLIGRHRDCVIKEEDKW